MKSAPFVTALLYAGFCCNANLLAQSISGDVTQVRLPAEAIRFSFTETSAGMAVRMKAGEASIQSRKMYVGDGSVAILLEANDSGIWLQGTEKYRQADTIASGSTINVKRGFLSVNDLKKGDVYVVLEGIHFELPKQTEDGKGKIINLDPSSSGFFSVAYSPDGKTIAVASISELRILDAATGKHLPSKVPIRPGWPAGVTFGPKNDIVASTGAYGVKLWDTRSGQAVLTMPDHDKQRNKALHGGSRTPGVAVSPDGSLIATVGINYLTIWQNQSADPSQATPLARKSHFIVTNELASMHATQVAFNPSGTLIATASMNWTADSNEPTEISFWNPQTGKQVRRIPGGGGGLTFSPDGKWIASGLSRSSNRVAIWNSETGKLARTLGDHEGRVTDVAFSPDGRRMASSSIDQTVRLWNVEDGTEIAVLRGHTGKVWSLAFHPDGRTLASVSSKAPSQLILWDTNDSAIQRKP